MNQSEALLRDLQDQLSRLADQATRDWWERYLRHEARFRGVNMGEIRRVVKQLVEQLGLKQADSATYLDLADRCFQQPWTEDKLAGVLLLAEHGLDTLDIDHVDDLARLFKDGHIFDWNVCDWYCVKVLGPFVTTGDDVEIRARAIAAWCDSDLLWQKRAAAVTFVNHASADPIFSPASPTCYSRSPKPTLPMSAAGARPASAGSCANYLDVVPHW